MARKGSGKQILMKILEEISTSDVSVEEATRKLRCGLLLHGSTSLDDFSNAKRLSWVEKIDRFGTKTRAIGLEKYDLQVIDVFRELARSGKLTTSILELYPNLDSKSCEAVIWSMWLILSATRMNENYLKLESGCTTKDVTDYIEDYSAKYDYHFKEFPDDDG